MSEKTISVIIPVYNTEKWLHNCIKSVIGQSYKHLEIILVNDGSTDNSLNICQHFAEQDDRIIVIDQLNAGVSSARNKGIDVATGDYVTFVDSDDAIDPQMYEKLIELLDETNDPQCKIAHCSYKRVRPDGSHDDIGGTGNKYFHDKNTALTHLLSGTLFTGGTCNKLFDRTLFSELRFDPNLKINEDVLVCFNAFLQSERSVFYDVPLYHYNDNSNSSCNTTNLLKKALDGVIVGERIYKACQNTALVKISAQRYYFALCIAYRAYLFDSIKTSKKDRDKLRKTISIVKKHDIDISFKHKLNYLFMRCAPHIYVSLYKIYDKIRVPNWDVN